MKQLFLIITEVCPLLYGRSPLASLVPCSHSVFYSTKSRLRTASDEKLDESLGMRLGHLSLPVSPTLDEPEFTFPPSTCQLPPD